ncbi:hypothetical protein SAMD00019534_075270 [Acytostelium subglobosum LB1]|uniref:hypothetical protein n=1 Tax=Acytostelium subglobosum LB1 TaxID=1410327 RepID=UPI000644A880|nr:hypothetical protein SAMD00019534_075270 [Acytostelium subglobosum LB1]GAM24352.1 hypothetical protein SAMD00019534_075270 [Acytostelium subglobosum LB1]|eukprot:XP_012752678.1 hypothetical protein SAMD00019534_075270 [Acytostelium subglobosum LB1]
MNHITSNEFDPFDINNQTTTTTAVSTNTSYSKRARNSRSRGRHSEPVAFDLNVANILGCKPNRKLKLRVGSKEVDLNFVHRSSLGSPQKVNTKSSSSSGVDKNGNNIIKNNHIDNNVHKDNKAISTKQYLRKCQAAMFTANPDDDAISPPSNPLDQPPLLHQPINNSNNNNNSSIFKYKPNQLTMNLNNNNNNMVTTHYGDGSGTSNNTSFSFGDSPILFSSSYTNVNRTTTTAGNSGYLNGAVTGTGNGNVYDNGGYDGAVNNISQLSFDYDVDSINVQQVSNNNVNHSSSSISSGNSPYTLRVSSEHNSSSMPNNTCSIFEGSPYTFVPTNVVANTPQHIEDTPVPSILDDLVKNSDQTSNGEQHPLLQHQQHPQQQEEEEQEDYMLPTPPPSCGQSTQQTEDWLRMNNTSLTK